MGNPFFDQNSYLWNRAEAARLHRALSNAVPNPAKIDLLYRMTAADLPPLALQGVPPELIWKEALEHITSCGRLRAFLAMEDVRAYPAVCGAAEAMLNADVTASTGRVYDGPRVLDRSRLHGLLAGLATETSQTKVILVRGAPRSGKTHSRHRFEWMARQWGAAPVYLCGGMVASVDEVVYKLYADLESTDRIPPRENSTYDAWYRMVCFKLQELASARKRRMWIAIDDLGTADDGTPLLDTEIRKFFDQFALNMVDPSFSAWFRLMLIHYPDAVPTKWAQDLWCEDLTSDADVQRDHVAEVIRSWSVTNGRTILEEEVVSLADRVITTAESAPGPDVPRLRRIDDALTAALGNLEGRLP